MTTSNNFHTRIVNKPNRNWLISGDEWLFVYITFGALGILWETEQTKSFAVSWLKSILLYNYRAGNKRRGEMSYSRVLLVSLLAKRHILSFTRNIWRKMSFQVKFQFKIRQKCRSKWNDIGHTLELGHRYFRKFGQFCIQV